MKIGGFTCMPSDLSEYFKVGPDNLAEISCFACARIVWELTLPRRFLSIFFWREFASSFGDVV